MGDRLKIYLVLECMDHEGSVVKRAFKDKDRADKECVRLESVNTWKGMMYYEVEPMELE